MVNRYPKYTPKVDKAEMNTHLKHPLYRIYDWLLCTELTHSQKHPLQPVEALRRPLLGELQQASTHSLSDYSSFHSHDLLPSALLLSEVLIATLVRLWDGEVIP